MIKKLLFTFLTVLILCGVADAKYTQTCGVKYKKNFGWSDYYTVDVTFMSGAELNKATKSYDYSSYSTYGVIFWSRDEVTIIKISSYTGCGREVKQRCITNKYSNMEGEDQQGRGWEICSRSRCY